MSKSYPSSRYHPEHPSKVVHSAEEDAKLIGWFESPADYGVETCPGKTPDPAIAAKREEFLKSVAAQAPIKPKRSKA